MKRRLLAAISTVPLACFPGMAAPFRRNPKSGAAMVTWWQARVGDVPASDKSEVMHLISKRHNGDAP